MNRWIYLTDGYIHEDDEHMVICIYRDCCKACMGISYQALYKYGSNYLMNLLDDLEHGHMSC